MQPPLLADLGAELRAGRTTARALVEACLARIEDPGVPAAARRSLHRIAMVEVERRAGAALRRLADEGYDVVLLDLSLAGDG